MKPRTPTDQDPITADDAREATIRSFLKLIPDPWHDEPKFLLRRLDEARAEIAKLKRPRRRKG